MHHALAFRSPLSDDVPAHSFPSHNWSARASSSFCSFHSFHLFLLSKVNSSEGHCIFCFLILFVLSFIETKSSSSAGISSLSFCYHPFAAACLIACEGKR
jgi:hypothetical protein